MDLSDFIAFLNTPCETNQRKHSYELLTALDKCFPSLSYQHVLWGALDLCFSPLSRVPKTGRKSVKPCDVADFVFAAPEMYWLKDEFREERRCG